MLTVEDATRRVMERVPPPRPETRSITECLGYVLAEDVVSDIDMPPFDKSAMDGYAVMSGDVEKAPVELQVIEEIPAGAFPSKRLSSGQAAKIMTGAPLPAGADAVVMVEKTEASQPGRVKIVSPVKRGQHVCVLAEDLRAGEIVLKAGAVLRAQEIGILATVGKSSVRVFAKPRVSMIVTGNELVEVHEKPGRGQIRNSNGYSVSAQVQAMGLECVRLGIARDTMEDLARKIREGLDGDVLIMSGGVSVGEYDLVMEALHREGVDMVLHQVAIKPGRPFYFGTRRLKRIFALPGNPVSSFVIFEVFVRPFLGRMMGYLGADRPCLQATLSATVTKESEREQLLPAIVNIRAGGYMVETIPWHGSADLFALARCNAFAIVPPNTPRVEAGSSVSVLLLDSWNHQHPIGGAHA